MQSLHEQLLDPATNDTARRAVQERLRILEVLSCGILNCSC